MLHHRTFFPVIVFGLTIVLGVVIFVLFQDQARFNNQDPVTAVEYQSEVHRLVGNLRNELASDSSNEARVQRLNQTVDQLLELVVPSDYKDVHLEMVTTLNSWKSGFGGDEGKRAAAEQRWNNLINQYYWIE